MTNGSGNGADRIADLAAYERLPAAARRYLQDAPDNIGAESMHRLLNKWNAWDDESAAVIANWYKGILIDKIERFWDRQHPQYRVDFEPIKRREFTAVTVYERRLAKKGY